MEVDSCFVEFLSFAVSRISEKEIRTGPLIDKNLLALEAVQVPNKKKI